VARRRVKQWQARHDRLTAAQPDVIFADRISTSDNQAQN
jgi:hypothetical protein